MSTLITIIMSIAIYTKVGSVTEIRGDIVTIEDCNGNLWCYYSDDDVPNIGDDVVLTMSNNGTADEADDIVVGVSG